MWNLYPGENTVKSTVSGVWLISRSDQYPPTSVSEQTRLQMNEYMSGEIIVWLIICQELTLIELSFSLIRHDPFLPQPPLPVCTYSTSIHVYTDCKIRGIYISISHKPLTVIHIDANTKRHTHWCRNTSKRTNTHTQKHGHSTGDVHLQTQPPA